MNRNLLGACCVVLIGLASVRGEDPPPSKEPVPAETKKDYADFSRLIHKVVAKEMPREYEDQSGWGRTIPIPEKVRLPGLPRTLIKVGDRMEMPHGLWKRYRVTMKDPDKDLRINVKDFTKVDGKTFRVAVDADAAFVGEAEVKHWQKGFSVLGGTALADGVANVDMVLEVTVTLNVKKFPPEVNVEPKVTEIKVHLKEFNLRQIDSLLKIQGEQARGLGNELKELVNGMSRTFEPQIKDLANDAIAQSLKDGKGNISASTLLQLPKAPAPKLDAPSPNP